MATTNNDLQIAVKEMMRVISAFTKASMQSRIRKNKHDMCINEILFYGFVGALGNKNTRGETPLPPYSEDIPKYFRIGKLSFDKSLIIGIVLLAVLDVVVLEFVFAVLHIPVLALIFLVVGGLPLLTTYCYFRYAQHNTVFIATVEAKKKYQSVFESVGLWKLIDFITYRDFSILSDLLSDMSRSNEELKAAISTIKYNARENVEVQNKLHITEAKHNEAVNRAATSKAIDSLQKSLRNTSAESRTQERYRKSRFDAAQREYNRAAEFYRSYSSQGLTENALRAKKDMDNAAAKMLKYK